MGEGATRWCPLRLGHPFWGVPPTHLQLPLAGSILAQLWHIKWQCSHLLGCCLLPVMAILGLIAATVGHTISPSWSLIEVDIFHLWCQCYHKTSWQILAIQKLLKYYQAQSNDLDSMTMNRFGFYDHEQKLVDLYLDHFHSLPPTSSLLKYLP